MKKAVLISFLCLFSVNLFALEPGTFVYAEGGIGRGNLNAYKLALNGIYNSYCFSLAYNFQMGKAKDVPSDFKAYEGSFLFPYPVQEMRLYCMTFGKVFPSHRKHRYLISGGLTFGESLQPLNYRKRIVSNNWDSDNYYYDYETIKTIGILINPKVEYPIGRFLGCTFGGWACLTNARITYGLETSFILGFLRERQ